MSEVRVWKVDFDHPQRLLCPHLQDSELPTLDSTANQLPQGVYTTLRTYEHNKVFDLEAHFQRLEESARLLGREICLDRHAIRRALLESVAHYTAEQDLRLRILIDLESEPGAIYIACEILRSLPEENYRKGVRVITLAYERENPKAKSTGILHNTRVIRDRLVGEVNEALLIDEGGLIREGLSSNFFAVQEGVLWTAGEGVLSGMTRQVVLKVAQQAQLKVIYEPLPLSEIGRIQEAFITSASRGILPVRQVDDQVIGEGEPGPITRLLADLYTKSIQVQLQEILS